LNQPLTLALAQISPKVGALRDNLAQHLRLMEEASQGGANLVIFPELSLTGYYLRDLVAELACKPQADDPLFGPLLAQSDRLALDAVVGFVEEDRRGRFFISAAYLSRGRVLHVHRKVYLPTYTLFEDSRFFAAGDGARAFETPFGRFGLLVCEDYWHISLPYLLWQDGADLLIFINASPGRGLSADPRMASARWVEKVSQAYSGLFTVFVVNCNRVGYEDGVAFGGGSHVIDPDGETLLHCPYFEEALAFCTLDLNQIRRARARLPLLRDERPELLYWGLKRLIEKPSEA
jgi:predicted amidohydrolase